MLIFIILFSNIFFTECKESHHVDNIFPFQSLRIHKNLNESQRIFYKKYGFLVLKDAYDPTLVRDIKTAARRLYEDHTNSVKSDFFLSMYNLWDKDPTGYLASFILSESLGALVADLMGVNGVRLYQDQVFVKYPGDLYSPPHQDAFAALLNNTKFTTAWIPLSENITYNTGALQYLPASHRFGQVL